MFLCRLAGGGEHAASREDIFSARGPYGGEEAVGGEVVAEVEHGFLVGAVEVYTGYGVKSYQVDAAV